jgi:hypothetical protein
MISILRQLINPLIFSLFFVRTELYSYRDTFQKSIKHIVSYVWCCGEPAISLHSPVMRDPGSNPLGVTYVKPSILLLALSCYIGDPDVIDHCGLVWGGPCPEPILGPRANNVIIPLDLTQLSCPCFTLAAGLPSGFTTDGVGCWGGALWRACNLTSFSACLTGPMDYPFTSRHKGPGFKSPGGYLCETGFSC